MIRMISFLALLLLSMPALMASQEAFQDPPRVVVLSPQDRQIKRLAIARRIPPQQVRVARRLLDEATELYEKAELEFSMMPSPEKLGSLWATLDYKSAPRLLESLFQTLADQAESVEEPSLYSKYYAWALSLAGQLAGLDPQAALQLIESWPKPSDQLGEQAALHYEAFRERLHSDGFREYFEVNPAQAIRQLSSGSSSRGWVFNAMAGRLAHIAQDRKASDQLLDQLLEQLEELPQEAVSITGLFNLIQQVSYRRPDRLPELLFAGLKAMEQDTGNLAGQAESILATEHGEAVFTPREMLLLQVLQNLYRHPQLALELVDSLPELKEKLDRLGGIDQGLRARRTGLRNVQDGKITYHRVGQLQAQDLASDYDLAQQFNRSIAGQANWVRLQLDQIAEAEGGLSRLNQIFSQARHPDLKEMILEVWQERVFLLEDPAQKLNGIISFLPSYRSFEGELTPDLINRSFQALEDFREFQEEESSREGKSRAARLDYRETFLLTELARIDAGSALLRLSQIEDIPTRISHLTQMAEALLR